MVAEGGSGRMDAPGSGKGGAAVLVRELFIAAAVTLVALPSCADLPGFVERDPNHRGQDQPGAHPEPEPEPSPWPDELPDPVDEEPPRRSDCSPARDAPEFRKVGVDGTSLQKGSCGEVAWEEGDSIFAIGIDGEVREFEGKGIPLWVDGDRLLYARDASVRLVDGHTELRAWPVRGQRAGPLPGGRSFWLCGRDGLARLDDEGVTHLETLDKPDCRAIDVTRRGLAAYPTNSNEIGVLDFVSGARKVLSQEFYPDRTKDGQGRNRLDRVQLSPNGSFLMHEKTWAELIGESVQFTTAPLTTIDLHSGERHHPPGRIGDGWVFIPQLGRNIWHGPWTGTSRGVYFPDPLLKGRLLGLGEPQWIEPATPLAARNNDIFLKTKAGAARLSLGTGDVEPFLDAPDVDSMAALRWGGPVMIGHGTKRCIRRLGEPCHTRIFALSSWEQDKGVRHVAWGDQPFLVMAAGPEGSSLVRGHVLDGEPPQIAERVWAETAYFVLDSEGNVVRELTNLGRFDSPSRVQGGEHFALVEWTRYDEDLGRVVTLIAVDWRTGVEKVLMIARQINWSLDHSERRVTARVSPHPKPGPGWEVWTGVISF